MLAFIRRNALDLTLWSLFVASVLLMLKSSTDPRPDLIKGTALESFFKPFPTGNQITFDVTVGVIVSLFVYVLVVRLPARENGVSARENALAKTGSENINAHKVA